MQLHSTLTTLQAAVLCPLPPTHTLQGLLTHVLTQLLALGDGAMHTVCWVMYIIGLSVYEMVIASYAAHILDSSSHGDNSAGKGVAIQSLQGGNVSYTHVVFAACLQLI